MQAARSSLANHTSIAELIKDITSEYSFVEHSNWSVVRCKTHLFDKNCVFSSQCTSANVKCRKLAVSCYCIGFYSFPTASEDFFDNLTVEQEFMSGIDTDKVSR